MSPAKRISRIYTLSKLKFNKEHYNNTSITQKMFPDIQVTPVDELLSEDIYYPYLRIGVCAVEYNNNE
jgi:hypothetical protein